MHQGFTSVMFDIKFQFKTTGKLASWLAGKGKGGAKGGPKGEDKSGDEYEPKVITFLFEPRPEEKHWQHSWVDCLWVYAGKMVLNGDLTVTFNS